jgi:hypothetical protein
MALRKMTFPDDFQLIGDMAAEAIQYPENPEWNGKITYLRLTWPQGLKRGWSITAWD